MSLQICIKIMRNYIDIDRLKCHETIRVHDILDLSKSEDEMKSDEEESNLQEMIEVAF